MKVLTFGWDFPPVKSGGLGVACYGLTRELVSAGVEVVFVLPRKQDVMTPIRFLFANVTPASVRVVDMPFGPYQSSQTQVEVTLPDGTQKRYSRSLIEEVYDYAHRAADIARREKFDIIHAHDWTSYLAGLAAKGVTGKPLIVHVHATSFDQAGSDNIDPEIYTIEKRAFDEADSIVTVSDFTKRILVNKHGVPPERIEVVHNGVEKREMRELAPALEELRAQGKKIVFFNGRITIQKGVDYFIRAARRVVDVDPNVMFVISGWGDMERQMMHLVGELGLSQHVLFAGSLWEDERDRMYRAADLFVMPSVSEPFGLVPLEALQHGTPVLISKQSGVSEVLTHALKVDFWDVEEMANKMYAAVRYGTLNGQLATEGMREVEQITWKRAADAVVSLYRKLLRLITGND